MTTRCGISTDCARYCGALPVSQLKKGISGSGWRATRTWSPATRRNVIAIILAAFNHAQSMHDVLSPLRGLKKPPSQPRLHSLSEEEEAAVLAATDECFGNFLFAAIRTGLRPFCELARLTADHVEETERGMMWRVYSTKTKKTRKIPVRPEVAKLARRLVRTAPKGSGIPLFRNTQGNAWKPVTGRGRFLQIKSEARLGQRSDQAAVLLLQLPPHVRPSHVIGLLERRGRMLDRDAGRIDRRHAEGGLRPLRSGVGATLSGTAVGGDRYGIQRG